MPWELFFAGGISVFFLLHFEPPQSWQWFAFFLILLSAFSAFITKKLINKLPVPQNYSEEIIFEKKAKYFHYAYYVFIFIAVFSAGFLVAHLRTSSVNWKVIPEIDEVVWVRGTVELLEPMEHGSRIILRDLDLWTKSSKKLPENITPEKIRLIVRTKIEDGVGAGSRIAVKVNITPPALIPVYPGGYNFSRYAFFNNIGGVGYTISEIKKFGCDDGNCQKSNLTTWLSGLQSKVVQRINSAFEPKDKSTSAVIVALLAGFQGGIPKETVDMMRVSGLAHILSISGLHMALVMFGVYFFIRKLCALSFTISNHINSKKLAAFFALPLGLAYLGISGFQVPAIRSYIMVTMIFLAVITDRNGIAMRSVLLAAFAILAYTPEAILSPSFQMSFSSVIALIAGFNWLMKFEYFKSDSHNFLHKTSKYTLGIIFSSIFAGLATGPIAAYHFGRISSYGLAANMLGVPLTSFVIMPAGMLALLAMPFGLEQIPLKITAWGVGYLFKIGEFVANWDGSQKLTPQIRSFPLVIYYSGFLLLCLFKDKIRYYSVPFLFFGFIGIINPIKPPDLIIGEGGGLYAVKAADNKFYFNSFIKGKFARKSWLEAVGQKEELLIDNLPQNTERNFICNNIKCDFITETGVVRFLFSEQSECGHILEINLTELLLQKCNNVTSIAKSEIVENGTVAVWLKPLKILTSKGGAGSRKWTQPALSN